jgi:hypothetical protein
MPSKQPNVKVYTFSENPTINKRRAKRPMQIMNAANLVELAKCCGFEFCDIDGLYDKFSESTFSRLAIECVENEIHLSHVFAIDDGHPKNSLWVCSGDDIVYNPMKGKFCIYKSFSEAILPFIDAIAH